MEKEYVFFGRIEIGYTMDRWETVRLTQVDGYKVDLLHRMVEIKENHKQGSFQISYVTSNNPISEQDLEENIVSMYIGALTAEFQSNDYAYSSWTQGTDYDSVFEIGGHNLLLELEEKEGQHIRISVKVK